MRGRAEAVVSHYHQSFSCFFGGSVHLEHFLHVDGVRLLAEDVLACFKSRNGDYRVQIVRGADIDRVDSLVLEKLSEVGVDSGIREILVPYFRGSFLYDVAQGDYFEPFIFQILPNV